MAVDLKFYSVDDLGNKKELTGSASFGNIYKGNQSIMNLAIYNAGDSTAFSPVLSVKQFGEYKDAPLWKSLSFDANSDNWVTELELDDIEPHSWLRGYNIQTEDWSGYSTAAGTSPSDDWRLWQSANGYWNVYNGYLQHYPDSQDGRASWGNFSIASDFEFSLKISVRANTYGGIIARHNGDSDTGYIILLQGIQDYFQDNSIPISDGVIQVYSGTFSKGYDSWKLLYESPSVGVRGTHDPFKIKLKGNTFSFWYNTDFNDEPLFTWSDPDYTYNVASRPVICTHAGYGTSINYFDDLQMKVENENGRVYVKSIVPADTSLYGLQYTLLDVKYGGEA